MTKKRSKAKRSKAVKTKVLAKVPAKSQAKAPAKIKSKPRSKPRSKPKVKIKAETPAKAIPPRSRWIRREVPLCVACRTRPAERHTKGTKTIQRRGLCWKCRRDPIVSLKFVPPGGFTFRPKGSLPELPTSAAPGTPGKIAVMAERAARGEKLFHPDDGRFPI